VQDAKARFKVCTVCRARKPATRAFFVSSKDGKLGLKPRCKVCDAVVMRAYRAAKPEKFAEIERRRRQRHGAKLKVKLQAYYQANRDARRDQQAASRGDVETRARLLAARREKYRQYRRDGRWAANKAISGGMRQALKGAKDGAAWESLVGYTRAELVAHLERQFRRGMSWSNYGKWHIDHIVPASAFVYASSSDPEFRACWALTNLRPLWRRENLSKHAKRSHLL
jgi:hypothetical protein